MFVPFFFFLINALNDFFFSCIIEKMILFGGRSAPTYHPDELKMDHPGIVETSVFR